MKTEITVQLFEDKDTILAKLRDRKVEFVENYTVVDHYFTKMSRHELYNSSTGAKSYNNIIRNSIILREIDNGDGDRKARIVHKNKVLDANGNVISEDKLGTSIGNLTTVSKILERAGLNCWCELVNHSTVYRVGEFDLAIQDIDGLGRFLEIEEPDSMKGWSNEEKFEYMKKFVQSLNLDIGENFSCKKPYMQLLKNLGCQDSYVARL